MDLLTRREFFCSLAALAVVAGVGLPIGLEEAPVPLSPGDYEATIKVIYFTPTDQWFCFFGGEQWTWTSCEVQTPKGQHMIKWIAR